MTVQKNISGYILLKNKDDYYAPPTSKSRNWKHWNTIKDEKTCEQCIDNHGKIYGIWEFPFPFPPLHLFCRCSIILMDAVDNGYATKDGEDGADWWLKQYGKLPDNYISYDDLCSLGWQQGDSPAKFAPEKMLARGIYQNRNGHLPQAPGRIWYEADINYYSGKRNGHRILWSNDGLIFVTYDHYKTFIEVK